MTNWKSLRSSLMFVVLFLGGFYLDRAFLGGKGSGQAQYLWLMAKIILTLVLSGAALLGLFKGVSWLWNTLADRAAKGDSAPTDDTNHNDKE